MIILCGNVRGEIICRGMFSSQEWPIVVDGFAFLMEFRVLWQSRKSALLTSKLFVIVRNSADKKKSTNRGAMDLAAIVEP